MFLAPFGRWEWSLKEGFHPISHLGLQHSLVDGLHYGEGAILNMDKDNLNILDRSGAQLSPRAVQLPEKIY